MELPTDPLSTVTKLNVPIPGVIGPTEVVPTPTLVIFIYSLSIFKILPTLTVDIPLKLNVVSESEIWEPVLFSKVLVISVKIKGYCVIPSMEIIVLVLDFAISNTWAFPDPTLVNVTADPTTMLPFTSYDLVVEIWNVSSSVLIAKTDAGKVSVPPLSPL